MKRIGSRFQNPDEYLAQVELDDGDGDYTFVHDLSAFGLMPVEKLSAETRMERAGIGRRYLPMRIRNLGVNTWASLRAWRRVQNIRKKVCLRVHFFRCLYVAYKIEY